MKRKDITKQVLAMHESETLKKFVDDAKQEVLDGVPVSVKLELESLLQKVFKSKPNAIAYEPRSKAANQTHFFAETELLAAAGQSLGSWFSQPINFAGVGFTLDVRRVIGTDEEVDLYLSASDREVMCDALAPFKGRFVTLTISNDGSSILKAELYIDESGSAAEGSGLLINSDDMSAVMGKINIDIQIQEQ